MLNDKYNNKYKACSQYLLREQRGHKNPIFLYKREHRNPRPTNE